MFPNVTPPLTTFGDNYDLFRAISIVSDWRGLKVKVKRSKGGKQKVYASIIPAATIVGAVTDGFQGLAIGALGGLIGASVLAAKGKYRQASEVIYCYLTVIQQEALLSMIRNTLSQFPPAYPGCSSITHYITTNPHLREAVLNTLVWFFGQHLKMKIRFQ